mmetsp:Transcript_5926/g.13819  ORF Transcript_5926/g.13819 Transcript_5926/m.13819 type:complete len:201 (-) Transcript_5926:172-774(-)
MHVHFSIRDATTEKPIFCHRGAAALLSPIGSSFVEGILRHLPGVIGLIMPTVNSYRRVGPGCWTGSRVGWAVEDKEVGIRVCSDLKSKEWSNVECKFFDASCNPYLGLAALLWSGLDGISKQLELRSPLMGTKSKELGDPLPGSLTEALDCMVNDTDLMNNLMGPRLSKAYIAVKRHEIQRSVNEEMTLEDEVKEALARS